MMFYSQLCSLMMGMLLKFQRSIPFPPYRRTDGRTDGQSELQISFATNKVNYRVASLRTKNLRIKFSLICLKGKDYTILSENLPTIPSFLPPSYPLPSNYIKNKFCANSMPTKYLNFGISNSINWLNSCTCTNRRKERANKLSILFVILV